MIHISSTAAVSEIKLVSFTVSSPYFIVWLRTPISQNYISSELFSCVRESQSVSKYTFINKGQEIITLFRNK
jgi:hypothetical protein